MRGSRTKYEHEPFSVGAEKGFIHVHALEAGLAIRGGNRPVAASHGGASGCNCNPLPLDAWQAMNIIHLIVYCTAIYTYLNDNCQLSACILCDPM